MANFTFYDYPTQPTMRKLRKEYINEKICKEYPYQFGVSE
jgi:hypothetical protein